MGPAPLPSAVYPWPGDAAVRNNELADDAAGDLRIVSAAGGRLAGFHLETVDGRGVGAHREGVLVDRPVVCGCRIVTGACGGCRLWIIIGATGQRQTDGERHDGCQYPHDGAGSGIMSGIMRQGVCACRDGGMNAMHDDLPVGLFVWHPPLDTMSSIAAQWRWFQADSPM